MGGFVLIFLILPISIILGLAWAVSKKKFFAQALSAIWIGIGSLFAILLIIGAITSFFELKKISVNAIYGEYVIDRTKYPGKQADWQYNHFRFELIKPYTFIFHETENNKIVKTTKGTIYLVGNYTSPHITIVTDSPIHHILRNNPTLYRTRSSFYYVFKSAKFGNVFLKKGHWEPIGTNAK